MKSLLFAASAFALGIGAAAAQDQAYDWSGAYIGVQAGYGWGKSDGRFTSAMFDLSLANKLSSDGAFGGIFGGYNYQTSSNAVLGLDVDLNAAALKGSDDYWDATVFGHFIPNSDYIPTRTRLDWSGSVRARLGYAMDRILPYVAVGFSFADYKIHVTDALQDRITQNKATFTGWNIGGGVEYAATDNILLRGEYRYTDFGRRSIKFEGLPGKVDLNTHDLRFGIAYKF